MLISSIKLKSHGVKWCGKVYEILGNI
uniref:Uncharacterized protein n=1 Tax=Tetranychus urticae TaxID=32264 RepID=T1KPF5_TETUR